MPIDAKILTQLIDREVASLTDVRVVTHIRGMLLEPCVVLLDWDYGEPGQQYPCWMVVNDAKSGGEIVYCEHGFGPRCPWGLVCSSTNGRHMGMDSGWFTTFLDVFFDSFACIELPIWRVFKVEADGTRVAITDEGAWKATWSRVYDLRRNDPTKHYDCGHSIVYGP